MSRTCKEPLRSFLYFVNFTFPVAFREGGGGRGAGSSRLLCASDGARDSTPAAPQRHGHRHGHRHNHKHLRCTWAQGLRRHCPRETEATITRGGARHHAPPGDVNQARHRPQPLAGEE